MSANARERRSPGGGSSRIVLGEPGRGARSSSGERAAASPLAYGPLASVFEGAPSSRAKALARRALLASLSLAGRGLGAAARARVTHELVAIALFAALVAFLSGKVRASVEQDYRYRVSKASLAASAPPRGLAPEAVQDLSRIGAQEAERASLRDRSFSVYWPESVPAVAWSYRSLPWVREVRAVESFYPARVRFDLVVRRPVAGLERDGECYLLDEEGWLLPRRCYEPGDPRKLGLPIIVNAHLGKRRLREGTRLEDVPVKHGIAVALGLQAPAFDPLRAGPVKIDVGNVNFEEALNRPEVVVIAGTTVVEWGRSEAAPGENIPLSEKIAHFAKAASERPIDKLSLVRLQFDDVEWREHAAPDPDPAPGGRASGRTRIQ